MTRQTTGGPRPRILYLQYTNPAAYPPIDHSSHILAEAGCEVRLLGTDILGDALQLRPHPGILVKLRRYRSGGWRQKLHYGSFLMWAVVEAVRWQPDWIYASDPLSCPIALALRRVTRAQVIYHEHDSPPPAAARASRFMRAVLGARVRLARTASICVLPNAERAAAFTGATGRHDPVTVWNCPRRGEVASRSRRTDAELRVFYHGSIVPARLPVSAVEALALVPGASLTVAGYETQGHPGYVEMLRRAATAAGVADRLHFLGTLTRGASMDACATCDVGLSLIPGHTHDVNEDAMVGASNKAFDYMACGLALLVSDRDDWRTAFVESGFGMACEPTSAASIATALRRWAAEPAERQAMGERGQRQILDHWNYEDAFRPVSAKILSASAVPVAAAQPRREGAHGR